MPDDTESERRMRDACLYYHRTIINKWRFLRLGKKGWDSNWDWTESGPFFFIPFHFQPSRPDPVNCFGRVMLMTTTVVMVLMTLLRMHRTKGHFYSPLSCFWQESLFHLLFDFNPWHGRGLDFPIRVNAHVPSGSVIMELLLTMQEQE